MAEVVQSSTDPSDPVEEPAVQDITSEQQAEQEAPLRLPFAFARKYGIALHEEVNDAEGSDTRLSIIHRRDTTLAGLVEVQRFLASRRGRSGSPVPGTAGNPPDLVPMDDEAFEQQIAAIYARDSHEARQMVEDLGDEVDLASLADAIPESEDLLDQ